MKAGDSLQSFERIATREQLNAYAHASGDMNPIHLDEEFATKKAGLPSVIVHGMLSMAFIADLVKKNFPDDSFKLLRLKSRFRRVTFPDEKLSCEATVKEVREDGVIVASLSVKNPNGEVTTDGTAEVVKR